MVGRKKTTGGLLAVVRAEERAERMLAKAVETKQDTLRKVLDDQMARLHNFKPPKPKKITLKPLDPDLDKYKKLAKKNKEKAVKKILGELNAAA